jgi:hypothetical protein
MPPTPKPSLVSLSPHIGVLLDSHSFANAASGRSPRLHIPLFLSLGCPSSIVEHGTGNNQVTGLALGGPQRSKGSDIASELESV